MTPPTRFVAVVLAAIALAVAGCGSSPEDKARDDGKAIGKALYELRSSPTGQDAQRAIATIQSTTQKLRKDASARVGKQVAAISDQIVIALRSPDAQIRRDALLSARSQYDALSSETDSVLNEFRRGVREGWNDASS